MHRKHKSTGRHSAPQLDIRTFIPEFSQPTFWQRVVGFIYGVRIGI
jgi:hypothetical protein